MKDLSHLTTKDQIDFTLNEVIKLLRQVYIAKKSHPDLFDYDIETKLDDIHDKFGRINNKRYL